MSARRLLTSLLALSTAACVAGGPSSSPDGCDTNPEPGIGQTSQGLVASNRISANRIAANRIAANRIASNRIAVNRISVNRIAANRIAVNNVSLDGVTLEGERVKGLATASNVVGLTEEGEEMRGETFVGAKVVAILTDDSEVELEYISFERTADPAVVHYGLAYQGENLCEAGIGMFVAGYWDERAAHHTVDDEGELAVSYTCVDGVIGKCVGWGYAGWEVGSDLHAACVRMGTADYCGQGVSFTKDGTAIDFFDAQGLQQPEGDETFLFEAGWGTDGAVCVNRPRYDAVTVSGEAVQPSCWASLATCESWESALSQGATIGNASRVQSRTLCE